MSDDYREQLVQTIRSICNKLFGGRRLTIGDKYQGQMRLDSSRRNAFYIGGGDDEDQSRTSADV